MRVREKIQTGRKWPTADEQAANRLAFDARLDAEERSKAELRRQCKDNGRCDHGPRITEYETWVWREDGWDWSEERHKILAEGEVASCWHGLDGRCCQHFWLDNGMPSCRLLHATDRELLPPWARSDGMSDEEWIEKLQQWVRSENEREHREKADRSERHAAGSVGAPEADAGKTAGEAPGTPAIAGETATADTGAGA
jgi:hypothetical protein